MITCFSTGIGLFCGCLSTSTMRAPCSRRFLVSASKSEPNCEERLQLTELRVRQLERTGNLLHRLDLRVAADAGYRNTRVYRRTDTGVEQLGLEGRSDRR